MVSILICDDDLEFTKLLKREVRRVLVNSEYADFDFTVVTTCNPRKALSYCLENSVQIILLDIDMPGLNGFDIATVLKETRNKSFLLFISGFDYLVYTSFRFKPFRFIRKAELNRELQEAILSALRELLTEQGFLILSNRYHNKKLFFSDIIYMESRKNYVELIDINGDRYQYRSTMNAMEVNLSGYDFIRIHSAYIISMKRVMSLHADVVTLQNGQKLPISRKYISSVRSQYADYLRR